MSIDQVIKPFVRYLARNGTILAVGLIGLSGCSDGAERALASGAMAQQQLQAGNLPAARSLIAEAISSRDDIVDLHLLKGRIELAAGSPSAAYDAFSTALSLDPANGQALQGVSQLGLTTGHLSASLEATQRILTLSPNQPDAMLTLGIHELVRRRYDNAIIQADKILALLPNHENATILKARASFKKGDSQAALAALDNIGSGSRSVGIAMTRLEIFRELRRPEEMAAQFSLLRSLRPDDLELRLDEANFRFKRGERESAHRLLTSALSHSSATGEFASRAGRLWEEYGAEDLPDALVVELAREAPVQSKQAVARVLIDADRLEQAEIIISQIQGQSGEGLSAWLFARSGRTRQALELAKRVLENDKTQCDALVALSLANLATKQPERALQSGQLASAECPTFSSGWLASAEAYNELGRDSGVERIYAQSIDAMPQSLRLVRSFTAWLLLEKRNREAVATARRLTRDAPALLGAWRHYALVCRQAELECEDQAAVGLENAKTIYAIDALPGEALPNGLFGRLSRR